MKLYATEYAAAKAYAKLHGIKGRAGGWLYFKDGTRHERVPQDPFTKGWAALIDALLEAGIMVVKPGPCYALEAAHRSLQETK